MLYRRSVQLASGTFFFERAIVFQNGAKPFAALDFTSVRADFLGWLDQLVVQRLMVPLAKHSTSQ